MAGRTLELPVEVRYKDLPEHLRLAKVRPARPSVRSIVHDTAWSAKDPVLTDIVELRDITVPGEYSRTIPLAFPPTIRPKRPADAEIVVTFVVELKSDKTP